MLEFMWLAVLTTMIAGCALMLLMMIAFAAFSLYQDRHQ